MFKLFFPAQELARAAEGVARATRPGLGLRLAAGVTALAGAGFVVAAGYLGLRMLVGPVLAGLAIGALLLAIAALGWQGAGQMNRGAGPSEAPAPTPQPLVTAAHSSATLASADPMTLAAFTAAFVLGRRLADKRRD